MNKSLLWDLPTRLFHWLLVVSIIAQYATAEWLDDAVQWHFYIGYFTLFLIAFRVIWGFVGTRYALFSHFVKKPHIVWRYVTQLFNRQSAVTIGHNPLGGWFVLIMLFLVGVQAISGLYMTDDIFLDGPYRALASDEVIGIMTQLHHVTFDVLLYVIALHIGAVVFYSVYKKQRLVPAMVHGKQNSQYFNYVNSPISHSKLRRALVVALIAAALVYVAVEIYPPAPDAGEYYYY
ncbi:cytochrome b/b6 domain-containing protein [Alteromonas sp. D210916BOD_24]|uniref:cytochrome b/b6 domain-containing protein n=1 Tax=Alteromonas sp. D210916BOD_24 TaxID=3157618 RepID=UPI00399C8E94